LILLGVLPLGGYNYITPRRAGLSATAGLSCLSHHLQLGVTLNRTRPEMSDYFASTTVTKA